MKESTKRILLIVIPVLVIVGCVLSVAGGYGYYLNAKKKTERGASREFRDTFTTQVTQLWWYEKTDEESKLWREYGKLRAQRNEARASDNKAGVLRLTNEIGAAVDKMEKIYDIREAMRISEGGYISELHEKALKLSDEKKKIALSLVAKTREANNLGGELGSLHKEGIRIMRELNESHTNLAKDQISVAQFNEAMAKLNSDTENNDKKATKKNNQISRTIHEFETEWAKLKPLLGSDFRPIPKK